MKEMLKNKLYVSIMIADIISNFGDILYYLALMNYVVQVKQSSLAIVCVSISETLPILLAFLLGYIADRCKNRISSIMNTLLIRIGLYILVAYVIQFNASLLIVIIISIVNCISDILGQYENSLYYPISNRLVRKDIRENVMAFRQSLNMSLNVLFQTIGGILIIFISYQKLALVNAATFAISYFIIIAVKPLLEKYCDTQPKASAEKQNASLILLVKSIISELKNSVKTLWSIGEIKETLISIPILNGGLAIITSLAVLLLAKDNTFMIISSEITISLIAASATLGRILGSFLTMNLFKNINLITALKASFISVALIFIGLLTKNIVLVIAAILLSNVWTGCIDPKMGATIFNNIDENKLATTFGGIVTYFQIGDIVSRVFFAGLVLVFEVKVISLIYIVLCIYALILLFKKSDKL